MNLELLSELLRLSTILLIEAGLMMVSALSLHIISKYPPHDKGLLKWRDGVLICGLGSFFLGLYQYIPVEISVVIGISLSMIGTVIIWLGTRLLFDHKDRFSIDLKWIIVAVVVLVLPTIFVRSFGVGFGLRAIEVSTLIAIVCVLCIRIILKQNVTLSSGPMLMLLGFIGIGTVSALRIVLTIAHFGDTFKSIDYISYFVNTVFFITLILGVVVIQYEKQQVRLKRLASFDGLTQLPNRRSFYDFSARVLSRARRHHGVTSVAMLDLDNFKEVNDNYGHQTGDKALQHFANILAEEVRDEDMVARLGGEEFAVILPDTMIEDAYTVVERIREKLAASPLKIDGKSITMSVSIGLTSGIAIENIDELIKVADVGLYQAKNQGRNRSITIDINRCPQT